MYHNYQNYIRNNFDVSNFKRNEHYTAVLEHVSYELGTQFATSISSHPLVVENKISVADIIRICKKNDSVGSPEVFVFFMGTKLFTASPSSLRYVYHSLLIAEHFMKIENPPKSFVEIGGGYGGLFVILDEIFQILGLKIEKYYIIDLPEGNKVQREFFGQLEKKPHSPCEFLNAYNYGNEIFVENEDDKLFLISCYCLSAIETYHRQTYIDKLICPKVKHGFLAWNFIPFEPFGNFFNFEVQIETPMTGNPDFNKYIRF